MPPTDAIDAIDAIETYVIRSVRIDELDVAGDTAVTPDRRERKAALRFDSPMVAAEALLAPPDSRGRYRVLSGGEQVEHARRIGRAIIVAAVVRTNDASPRVLGRWQVHHAARCGARRRHA